MSEYEKKLKEMNENLLKQLQEVKDELKQVKKGKEREEDKENKILNEVDQKIRDFRKIFDAEEESESEDEIQHEISFSEQSNSNSFNNNFSSKEEKEDYFDNLFGRNKPGNLTIDELEEKYNELMEETYPDLENGTKEQQLYYYKRHPRNYGSSRQPTIIFGPGNPDEEALPSQEEGENFAFRSIFCNRPPVYTTKEEGYDFLRDIRGYLEDYYPRANEKQVKDALLSQVPKEIQTWYKKDFLEKFDLKDIQWNQTPTWRKLNNLVYHFEKEFCEFSISQQENKWKSITPIKSISEENVKEKIKEIENLAQNLNYSYYARISKLIKTFSKSSTFINKCIGKLPQAPSKNPREDFEFQNNRNSENYKRLINIIFEDISKLEGEKINQETWKGLLQQRNCKDVIFPITL